jgi:GDP-D-mannose 3',5'-epimerase
MEFIFAHHSEIPHNNSPINIDTPEAARMNGVQRYFYTSSACAFPEYRQSDVNVVPLKEEDGYPAMPEDGYGWEKLFSGRMCRHFSEDSGLQSHVARFHNVDGRHGTYDAGRENALAAICRKIILLPRGSGH